MPVIPPPCDACGSQAWTRLFSDGSFDLGRCSVCGLHYVAQMPALTSHMTELEAGHFGDIATRHLQGEAIRLTEFDVYLAVANHYAPVGPWLDIGCGTGGLLSAVQRTGRSIAGIELTPDRRALAAKMTGATIYGQPLEALSIPAKSYAVVSMVQVFSHLLSPRATLSRIRDVLIPGGIVLLRTGEVGPGVQKRHLFSWDLGDHLYFLGDQTIECYAQQLGYTLVERQRTWLPESQYTRKRFLQKGRSRWRNAAKAAIVYTPGALSLLRWYMLRRQVDNPIHTSTIVLRSAA